MSERPMTEEREKALKKHVHAMMRRDCDSIVPARWCVETGFCRCQLMLDLLSTSSAERGMREALEKIDARLKPQFDLSNSLTKRDRLSLLTTLHTDRVHADDMDTIEEAVEYIDGLHNFLDRVVSAALSGIAPGDEQARGQGRSESTDTKGTSK